MERVFSIVRKIYDWKPSDDLKDLDVNTVTWEYSCLSHFKLQFILDEIFLKNLRSVKNQSSESVKHLFRTTEKLIKDQKEIAGLSTIDWNQLMWRESSPLCDRAVQIMKSKTCGFSDSVLCLGGISTEPFQACESKIKWFLETRCLEDLDRIDGEHMEFECTIF